MTVARGWESVEAAPIVFTASVLVVAVGTGAAIAQGSIGVAAVLATLAFLVAVCVGLHNWRWSLYGLFAYLPFSGIPIVLAYPDRLSMSVAVLAKDIFFVLPAYLGFSVALLRRQVTHVIDGVPARLLALFGVLVVAQAFNPGVPSGLVGLIGIKVWLLYVPMVYLTWNLVRDRSDLSRLLSVMVVAAIVPEAVGIIESVLIQTGRADLVYVAYGDAAGAVTQAFADLSLPGGGHLRRVPSTFSSVTQFVGFLMAMTAVGYGWWRVRGASGTRPIAGLVWLLAPAAALLSGSRMPLLAIPVLVATIIVLDRGRRGRAIPAIALAAAFIAVAAVFEVSVPALVSASVQTATVEFDHLVLGDGASALAALGGRGTGIDTAGARYGYSSPSEYALFHDWREGWYVKALLELGVVGLAVVACLGAVLLSRVIRCHRALGDSPLRALSAAIVALLLWAAVASLKGQYLDFDPLNVYIWVLLGLAFRLPVLERERSPG